MNIVHKLYENILQEKKFMDMPFSFKYAGKYLQSFPEEWHITKEEKLKKDTQIQFTKSVQDPVTGLLLTIEGLLHFDYHAIEWVIYLENTGNADTPILEDILPLDMRIDTSPEREVFLHQIHGDDCSEKSFAPFDTQISYEPSLAQIMPDKVIDIIPVGGRSSQVSFPFFNLDCSGEGLIVAIGWTGQWKTSLRWQKDGSTSIKAGMEKTHLLLHPGERIRTPRILLMPWQGTWRAAQNTFRQLMLAHYAPRVEGKLPQIPIAAQNFDMNYINPDWFPNWATEEGQIKMIEYAEKLSADTHWLDAAWFEGDFPYGSGNWIPKKKEFPRGLKPIADAAHKKNMRFIVWFEPERVVKGTLIHKEHPEWLLASPQTPKTKNYLFNLGIPEARLWMTDLLANFIKESGIDWYRQDFNMDPLDYWRSADDENRQGMTEIRYVEGMYAFWDELRRRLPGLCIDNCSSGGRRIDLETCMRAIPLWRSDSNCFPKNPHYAEWNQMQTAGLCQYVPLASTGSWYYDAYTLRGTATMGVAAQFDVLKDDFPFDEARKALEEIRNNRKYWLGDFYPLIPPSLAPEGWIIYQFHRADLDAGVIYAFRHAQSSISALTVDIEGITEGGDYQLLFSDEARTVTQKTLNAGDLKKGLLLAIPQRRASLLVKYSEVKMQSS